MKYLLLDKIKSPYDVKKLSKGQTDILCKEIRDCILNVVSKNGGHLASNLGVVELTVALHMVFDSPKDTIIFDVGHQCYTHKLLTGRYSEFTSLRQKDGISGFLRPQESPYDAIITGHSSSSVSAAYGILKGNQLQSRDRNVVAVLGDGALTGGMVYEALNNIGKDKSNLIIVLNDNRMSISHNVGALARQLTVIRSKPSYFKFKNKVEHIVEHIPLIGKRLRKSISRSKMFLKSAIYNSNIFEGLGLQYMGPVDGHNVTDLTSVFSVAKELKRSVLVHVITKKGKGYSPSEKHPGNYHGVAPFDIKSGVKSVPKTDFSSVFGKTLCEIARNDDKICAITAAMSKGTGLEEFKKQFPDRFFDVGIAEEHAATFSAGLAVSGMKPVFAVYSSFLQRSYDQIIHDCAIANLPVTFCVDRAGIVGEDGETHNGLFDVSFLSSIPNVKIYSPANFDDLENMLRKTLENPKGVAVIRYPRGTEPIMPTDYSYSGKPFDKLLNGDVAVVSYGSIIADVLDVAKEFPNKVTVYKLNEITNLNDELLNELMSKKGILFVEETAKDGGISQKTALKLIENGFCGKYKSLAVDGFVKQASVIEAKKMCNISCDSIKHAIIEVLNWQKRKD